MLQELGITREDILDKAAEKLLDRISIEEDLAHSIKRAVSQQLVDAAKGKIETLLNDAIGELIDTPFTPVDEWGEPTRKQSTTLRKLVKERAIGFLAEKVDRDGKTTSYNSVGSRGEWMARKAAESAIDFECKKELTAAVEAAKADIKKRVADHITEILLRR